MRILIVDNEQTLADTLAMILERKGHRATPVYSPAAALEKMESFVPDCVISDLIMPEMLGTELCAHIEKKFPGCRILLFSGRESTNELVENAREQGRAWELLTKPVDPRELLEKLDALQAPSLEADR